MREKRVIILAIVLMLLVAVDCASAVPPIKIGALTCLSGPFHTWGIPAAQGMEFAALELNEAKGVLGREVVVVKLDSKNDPDESMTLFRRLVELDRVVAVGGIISSGIGLATSRLAEELRVPLLLTMSGSHAILERGSRFTFRTALLAAPSNLEAFATFIKEKGLTRIGAIIADYAWGHAIKKSIEKRLVPVPGLKVQIEVAPVPETDFTPYLRKLEPLKPEIIITLGHPPGKFVATKQAIELGIGHYTTGSGDPPEVWVKTVGKPMFGRAIDITIADYEHPAYRELAAKFYGKFRTIFDMSAFSGYVIVKMVANAIVQTKSDDPRVIADFIRKGRFIQPGYAYPISYTEWGEPKEGALILYTFEEGDPGKINPGAWWRPKVVLRSPTITPYVPEK